MIDSLWSLFASALIAATLMPGGSEALLIYQLNQNPSGWLTLLAVATAGNVLGSLITFAMGWWLAGRVHPFDLNTPKRRRAHRWLERYGPLALLFAWVPVVGDPLCLVAGWLRVNWRASFMLILVGKLARYSALVWLSMAVI